MGMPECIITGCEFFSPHEGKIVHGDLHRIGDTLIFNACTDKAGNAEWRYVPRPWQGDMVITARSAQYFERRGVIVFEQSEAELNDRAMEYLKPKFGFARTI